MKLINPTKETLNLTIPTGRGGGVENLTVAPGESCEVADGYVGLAKRRGLAEPVAEPAVATGALLDTVGTATEEWGTQAPSARAPRGNKKVD